MFHPYPAHNRLDEARIIPVLACAYVPLFFLSLAGLVVGWKLLRPMASTASPTQSFQKILRQD